ncbi:MAG: hypothetical protein ACH37Z_12245 [Anaerolineae bacterium]
MSEGILLHPKGEGARRWQAEQERRQRADLLRQAEYTLGEPEIMSEERLRSYVAQLSNPAQDGLVLFALVAELAEKMAQHTATCLQLGRQALEVLEGQGPAQA